MTNQEELKYLVWNVKLAGFRSVPLHISTVEVIDVIADVEHWLNTTKEHPKLELVRHNLDILHMLVGP